MAVTTVAAMIRTGPRREAQSLHRIARRTPRALHPGAWWTWGVCLGLSASRTTNPLVLGLFVVVVWFVVTSRRPSSPWSRSFGVFLRIAVAALVVRVVLFALLAPPAGGHVLVRLPQVPLPSWLAGLRLGGPVTLDGTLAAAYDGMRLGVVLVCIGAANALTNPRRLLKSLPSALYEAGVALTVALAFVPQAVATVGRVRAARRLRGHDERGLRALRGIALPVLEGALERSVDLAAAMECRGFGRRGATPERVRRAAAALTLLGLAGLLASSYRMLDASAPAALGVPLLIGSGAVLATGFVVGARRGGRSRYRPDPWRLAEWLTVACAVATVTVFVTAPRVLTTAVSPPAWPTLDPAVALGLALAVLPAWLTPPLPRKRRIDATPAPVAARPLVEAGT